MFAFAVIVEIVFLSISFGDLLPIGILPLLPMGCRVAHLLVHALTERRLRFSIRRSGHHRLGSAVAKGNFPRGFVGGALAGLRGALIVKHCGEIDQRHGL